MHSHTLSNTARTCYNLALKRSYDPLPMVRLLLLLLLLATRYCTAVGKLTYKFARDIRPGDLLPVATSRDLKATFKSATVESVELLTAVGRYIPAVEMPFILADGVVAPM